MSAIAWVTVRNAIQQWMQLGSGLAGDHVVWRGQRDQAGNSTPRPSGMFIELALTLLRWKGSSDIRRYEYDAGTNTLTEKTNGPRIMMLTATCYQGVPTGGSGAPDPTACYAVLNDAMTSSGLDNIVNILVAAGVGVGDIDQMDVHGDAVNYAKFEARAIAQAKLHIASEVSYVYPVGTGWIQFVNADGLAGDLATVHAHVTS